MRPRDMQVRTRHVYVGSWDVHVHVQLGPAPRCPLGGVQWLSSHPAEHHQVELLPRAPFDSAARPR
jgi:hypothetical protein